MDNKRQKYLDQNWLKYPSFPKSGGNGLYGRVLELNSKLGVVFESKWSELDLNNKLMLNSDYLAEEVLINGDLILVIENTVTLLAPCLREISPLIANKDTIVQWPKFLMILRKYFAEQEFIEVKTPSLVEAPGMEAHLHSFKTSFVMGEQQKSFHLPTSPEFHLKKLLCHDYNKIFEIKDCFRNSELSNHHQAEFSMLEWYRAYDDLDSIMDDVEGVLFRLQESFPEALNFKEIDRVSMNDLWKRHVGIDLSLEDSKSKMLEFLHEKESCDYSDEDWDSLFHRVFVSYIETKIGLERPIIVYDFPASQSALARKNGKWADRFELYYKGLELANAFHELNDPIEQERRFQDEQSLRESMGYEAFPKDQNFHDSLYYGMPPSGGIALGVDRLFMICVGEKDIKKTRPFYL